MVMDYWITNGTIVMSKTDFTKEILRKDSILRILLGYNAGGRPSLKVPAIKQEDNGVITIDFQLLPETKLMEDPKELLGCLKQRYGEKITGKLTIKSVYTTFQQVYYFDVDLY